MAKNRVLVSIHAATNDSDAAATADIDLGPYIGVGGVREVTGVWVVADIGVASDTDHTFDMAFQEGATTANTDFATITAGTFTQLTTATVGLSTLDFAVTQRYLRGTMTLAGTAVSAYNFLGVIVTPRFDT